jgi:PadR family transcriptional regulator, regulatory protein AphA
MSTAALTPVSYLVLGLVACGASTSYELKQKVASSVGYMWSFPHSALYAEPARLADRGLLDEQQEEGGRRRRIYSITDEGRQALLHWLQLPTPETLQVRDLGLLKLFFAELLSGDEVACLAHAQLTSHRERLATYEAIEAEIPKDRSNAFPMATLRMGLMIEHAFVSFWTEIAEGISAGA